MTTCKFDTQKKSIGRERDQYLNNLVMWHNQAKNKEFICDWF